VPLKSSFLLSFLILPGHFTEGFSRNVINYLEQSSRLEHEAACITNIHGVISQRTQSVCMSLRGF